MVQEQRTKDPEISGAGGGSDGSFTQLARDPQLALAGRAWETARLGEMSGLGIQVGRSSCTASLPYGRFQDPVPRQ